MGRACAINCTTGAALTFLGLCLVPQTAFAASSSEHDTVEKTIPQGNDPPGTDEEQRTAPPIRLKAATSTTCRIRERHAALWPTSEPLTRSDSVSRCTASQRPNLETTWSALSGIFGHTKTSAAAALRSIQIS